MENVFVEVPGDSVEDYIVCLYLTRSVGYVNVRRLSSWSQAVPAH